MKSKLFILLFTCVTICASAQKYDTLYNKTIISLTKMGLPAQIIISKIRTSVTSFDVSLNGLSDLSSNGVSGDVIVEMIKVNDKANTQASEEVNSNEPTAMHSPGIYFYNPEDKENPLKKVDAFGVNYHTSSGGYGGYGGSSTTANLTGDESNLEINNASPVFYFYFNNSTNNQSDWYASSSPKEFFLVKLTVIVKKKLRLFKVGGSSSGMFSSSSSSVIPEKIKVQFDYIKVKEDIYKVTFKVPLEAGEYCFAFANNTFKVFDFGIKTVSIKK